MVIPLVKMLLHITQEVLEKTTNTTAKLLGWNMYAIMANTEVPQQMPQ